MQGPKKSSIIIFQRFFVNVTINHVTISVIKKALAFSTSTLSLSHILRESAGHKVLTIVEKAAITLKFLKRLG